MLDSQCIISSNLVCHGTFYIVAEAKSSWVIYNFFCLPNINRLLHILWIYNEHRKYDKRSKDCLFLPWQTRINYFIGKKDTNNTIKTCFYKSWLNCGFFWKMIWMNHNIKFLCFAIWWLLVKKKKFLVFLQNLNYYLYISISMIICDFSWFFQLKI